MCSDRAARERYSMPAAGKLKPGNAENRLRSTVFVYKFYTKCGRILYVLSEFKAKISGINPFKSLILLAFVVVSYFFRRAGPCSKNDLSGESCFVIVHSMKSSAV